MTYGTVNVDSLVSSDGGVIGPNITSLRNRIINGAMMIDQRNAGAAVTMSAAVVYGIDRWWSYEDTDGTMTMQQSSVAPAGFTNSLLCTTTVADASLGATQRVVISQAIEGFNIADLGWGTASAATVTLSFWVRSSLTGTFGGAFKGVINRSYPFSYTINSANTWEYKTVTVVGDTTSTWNTTNGTGFNINFGLGVGSTYSGAAGSWSGTDYNSATGATSVVGTNGATFYITGVQLEKGSTATSFDYRPYGTELSLCQRYYQTFGGNVNNFGIQGYTTAGQSCSYSFPWIVPMRAIPTVTIPTMNNTNTSGLGSNNPSALGTLLFATATATGAVSSVNLAGGTGSASAEL